MKTIINYFFLLLVSICLLQCSINEQEASTEKKTEPKIEADTGLIIPEEESFSFDSIKIGIPYFEFDSIIHYNIDLSSDSAYKLEQNYAVNKKLLGILHHRIEGGLNDTGLLADLSIIKSSKAIDPKYFSDLKHKIFADKKCGEMAIAACIPMYRDILIFKKRGKICGIAKICFQCQLADFAGAKTNTDCFGYWEFKGLFQILTENYRH